MHTQSSVRNAILAKLRVYFPAYLTFKAPSHCEAVNFMDLQITKDQKLAVAEV